MELSGKRTDLNARLAEPFFDGILTACATVHFEHRTQAVAVLRREPALIELHIVNAFDKERTEKPKEMHRRIDDRVIEQKQVLVGGTTTHVNFGTEIGTRDNAWERLDALDDVCFGKARHALDGFCRNNGFAGLALGAATQLHHDFLEFGYLRVRATGGEERIDVDVGRFRRGGRNDGVTTVILEPCKGDRIHRSTLLGPIVSLRLQGDIVHWNDGVR